MATLNNTIKNLSKTEEAIQHLITPEFSLKDVVQIIVGATILAIPVAFTEEVWKLGEELPWANISMLVTMSVSYISLFVYYNYYKKRFRKNWLNFLKRVIFTYLFSIAVVALMLTVINRADWGVLWQLSLKRALIIAFPA